MLRELIELYKKKIGAVVGRYYVFGNLERYIAKQGNREETIMALALLLGSGVVTKLVSWDKLRQSFFRTYCEVVLRWCGYDPVRPLTGRITLHSPEFVIVFFAEMAQSGLLNNWTNEELASYLYQTFNLPWEPSTICNYLKTMSKDSDYLPAIQALIRSVRKVDKYK